MKTNNYYRYLLLLLLISFTGAKTYAYDIAVANADGVTIYYNYINDGTELEVTSGNGKYIGAVNIPNEVTYMNKTMKVTSIAGLAFYFCSSLTSVTIPNSVTSIAGYAFYGCSSLTSVTIPNSVTSIGGSAFYGCSGLTSVTIPNSVTSIGSRAFDGCTALTSVTVGNSVTSIGENAFYRCDGLQKVIVNDIAAWCGITFYDSYCNPLCYARHLYSDEDTEITNLVIPNSVTSIGNYAFYGCSGLTSVTIGNSVISIGNSAFYNCSGLTSVTIPNSVTSIGENAFYNCRGFKRIMISSSVSSIGSYAFYGCENVEQVTSFIKMIFDINENVFSNKTYLNANLTIPAGKKEAYKAATGWGKFLNIEENEYGGSVTPGAPQCANPTISYTDKNITFECETEGVDYIYTITDSDIKSDVGSTITLSATYEITVYATKAGYNNSDMVTATLVWTDGTITNISPDNPSPVTAVKESVPVLVFANNGTITVKSEQDGQKVEVYAVTGQLLVSAIIQNGQASILTNMQRGDIAIVKTGNKSVKIKM